MCGQDLTAFLLQNSIISCIFMVDLQVAKTVDLIKAKGGKVTREPGPVKGGNTVIAFIEDPDGYKFELLERGPTPEPLCQVMLRVGDLDRSIEFYEKVRCLPILYIYIYGLFIMYIFCYLCSLWKF